MKDHLRDRCVGMTLIELMVTVAIMAVIAAGTFRVYSNLQAAHERVSSRTETLNQLQKFWHLFRQDLAMAIHRPAKPATAGFGGVRQDVFQSSNLVFSGSNSLLQWSRSGAAPVLYQDQVPSELRRIAYGVVDGTLYRYLWQYLEPMQGETPIEMPMIDHVAQFRVRFAYQPSQPAVGQGPADTVSTPSAPWVWVEQWPPMTSASENPTTAPVLPRVIEVTLEHEFGQFLRVFEVGAPAANLYAQWLSQSRTTASGDDSGQDLLSEDTSGSGDDELNIDSQDTGSGNEAK